MQIDPEQTHTGHTRDDNARDMSGAPKVGLSRDSPVDSTTARGGASRDLPMERVAVSEAAALLGVTQSAVRKRIQRGTITWDKDSEGRVYVYVDPSEISPETEGDESRDTSSEPSRDELLESYRDQVNFLRRELERKDTMLMSLMQRIPELEPIQETRDAPKTTPTTTQRLVAETPAGTESFQEPSERRSWLYRFFFGP